MTNLVIFDQTIQVYNVQSLGPSWGCGQSPQKRTSLP